MVKGKSLYGRLDVLNCGFYVGFFGWVFWIRFFFWLVVGSFYLIF